MQEWPNWHAWKALHGKPYKGSNPFASAFASLQLGYGEMKSAKTSESGILVVMWYVYILFCIDSKTYIGCTDNLRDRILRHQKGQVPATKNRLPIELEAYFACKIKYVGFIFEKYLKSGSGRAFLKKHLLLIN